MTIRVPSRPFIPPINTGSVDEQKAMRTAIVKELDNKLSRGQPVDELLLVSPTGFVYAVVVADDGTLSTQLRSTP